MPLGIQRILVSLMCISKLTVKHKTSYSHSHSKRKSSPHSKDITVSASSTVPLMQERRHSLVSKYLKRCITVDCMIIIQESGRAKVHGSEQLLEEALAWMVYDFWGLPKQQNEIRNILLSQTFTQLNPPMQEHLNPSPYHDATAIFKDI